MSLMVTLKVGRRDKRCLEVNLSEEQLASCRATFWDNFSPEEGLVDLARAAATLTLHSIDITQRDAHVRAMHAIAAVSLHVGGTYWYKSRAPKAEAHPRVRTFSELDGTITCPRCSCILVDKGTYNVEPHDFSKLLENPHFICYQCNAHVIVSRRRAEYDAAAKDKRSKRLRGDDNDRGERGQAGQLHQDFAQGNGQDLSSSQGRSAESGAEPEGGGVRDGVQGVRSTV